MFDKIHDGVSKDNTPQRMFHLSFIELAWVALFCTIWNMLESSSYLNTHYFETERHMVMTYVYSGAVAKLR